MKDTLDTRLAGILDVQLGITLNNELYMNLYQKLDNTCGSYLYSNISFYAGDIIFNGILNPIENQIMKSA